MIQLLSQCLYHTPTSPKTRTNGPMMQKVNTGLATIWTTINTYILIPVQDLHLTYTA